MIIAFLKTCYINMLSTFSSIFFNRIKLPHFHFQVCCILYERRKLQLVTYLIQASWKNYHTMDKPDRNWAKWDAITCIKLVKCMQQIYDDRTSWIIIFDVIYDLYIIAEDSVKCQQCLCRLYVTLFGTLNATDSPFLHPPGFPA